VLLAVAAAKTGRMPDEVSADAGFCSKANLAGLIDRSVRGDVATGRASRPASGTKGGTLVQAMRARIRQGKFGCLNPCRFPERRNWRLDFNRFQAIASLPTRLVLP
jgi:hypothetical protein